MGLFGRSETKSPKDQVKEWTLNIRKEGYKLDRQIRAIQREEQKTKTLLKQTALKNDRSTCLVLAKEIVGARKAINRIYTSKAHLNSVQLQMKTQLATLKIAGTLQKSTEVMIAMQSLSKVSELSEIMQNMSREMMKAGIIEEILDESFESLETTEDIEEEIQAGIDSVLWEITEGKLGQAPLPPQEENLSISCEIENISENTSGNETQEDLKDIEKTLSTLNT